MYCLLQYLKELNILYFDEVTAETIIKYLKVTKQTRQREVLCELRGIFGYLNREDLTFAIAGIHAPRIKRIIQCFQGFSAFFIPKHGNVN